MIGSRGMLLCECCPGILLSKQPTLAESAIAYGPDRTQKIVLSSLPLEGGRGVYTHLKACNGPQHHISNGASRAEAEGQPRSACHLVQPKNMCQIAALQRKKERKVYASQHP